MSSLEVDLSGVEEGSTITVKWRGKPVFIRHRSEDEIAAAANTPLTGLRDPQSDAERVVDPKVCCIMSFHNYFWSWCLLEHLPGLLDPGLA